MTGLKVLSNVFNKTVALTEFGSNYFLAFFVLMCIYVFNRTKNQSRLIKSLMFTLITFVSIVLFWGLSSALSNDIPIMYVNPIGVIFDAFVEMINTKGDIFKSFKGVPYVLGFQFLGVLAGFLTFIGLFYLFKTIPSNYFDKDIKPDLKYALFQNHNERTIAFSSKEAIFILLMTITIAITKRIPHSYGLNYFTTLLINMIVLFTILLFSSYFNFFSFHIFLATGFSILNLIFTNNKRDKIQIIKHYLIDLLLTIMIPVIAALITIGIYKGGNNSYAY
ncbi:MAG4940 family membrane protein [Mycoplasma tauri]|uniref:Uncharacterized protein n=1 Tax=Mycoplasma tauri TaxID=547987 RepID=A0A953ND47_9MOLU|nr:hypothetical protein [Mycoplasma tauri]MBZ4195289.1 hypothetical protein [Mycoplasma tauri]MBZ4203707.1 hypothetical protein [Mycoplasma tauri]MBZ4212866.1 hypothetical protein [Mycoplasma tauri]MBZ4218350.1 hypothetical protein [Mycoplasma tauri]MBZ4226605.1 hypothetical protein [Mycoplasma tauri]